MNIKSIVAAAVLSTVAATSQAGGLLNAERDDDVAPLPIAVAQPTGGLSGSILPIVLGVGAVAFFLSNSNSGGGT